MTLKPKIVIFITVFFSLNLVFSRAKSNHYNTLETPIEDWIKTTEKNKSRLKLRVADKAYVNFRNFVNREQLPLIKSFKLEQWLNAFYYDFEVPLKDGEHPVKITSAIAPCPWNKQDDLLMMKLKAKMVPDTIHAPINFVFLFDASESMNGDKRIEMFKNNLRELTSKMTPKDKISVVSYNVKPSIYFKNLSGGHKEDLLEEISHIWTGRRTNDRSKGLKTAYKIIEDKFNPLENNRVIVVSDGEWDVGAGSDNKLFDYIAAKRKKGIKLSVLGYDMSNEYDSLMIKMAINGGGNYAYVNSEKVAASIFKTEFLGINYLIARDVKYEIEFNPEVVFSYNLFGFEGGKLPNGKYKSNYFIGDDLTMEQELITFYQIRRKVGSDGNIGLIRFEYNPIEKDTSISIIDTIKMNRTDSPSIDFNFGSSVIEYSENFVKGKNRGRVKILRAIERAKQSRGEKTDTNSYNKREEFVELMESSLNL